MEIPKGSLNPVTLIIEESTKILEKLGFSFVLGPEIEDEWHNFDALNVPKDHPARDMQDTFYIKDKPGFVLRTHTSPVQVRYMETHTPPFAIAVPGKVFRNEATDSTHEMQFHQLEGLVVAPGITVSDMKSTLLNFFKELFGQSTKIRLRPSYFPFVEPGFEVDVWIEHSDSEKSRWLEVCGGGMVHPSVLENVGYDSKSLTGFAFGIGIDRLASVKYGITDVRLAYQGDLRFNQF